MTFVNAGTLREIARDVHKETLEDQELQKALQECHELAEKGKFRHEIDNPSQGLIFELEDRGFRCTTLLIRGNLGTQIQSVIVEWD